MRNFYAMEEPSSLLYLCHSLWLHVSCHLNWMMKSFHLRWHRIRSALQKLLINFTRKSVNIILNNIFKVRWKPIMFPQHLFSLCTMWTFVDGKYKFAFINYPQHMFTCFLQHTDTETKWPAFCWRDTSQTTFMKYTDFLQLTIFLNCFG